MQKVFQWYCDECGELIKCAKDGWLEWKRRPATIRYYDFRIVHHRPASPIGGCYYKDNTNVGDMHLDYYVCDGGLQLLTMLHPMQGNGVVDIEEWIEIFQRCHTPGFEEIRRIHEIERKACEFFNNKPFYFFSERELEGGIEHATKQAVKRCEEQATEALEHGDSDEHERLIGTQQALRNEAKKILERNSNRN